jgi:hypothetical protein
MSEQVVMTLEELHAEALAAETYGIDMSVPGTGSGDGPRILPAGYAFARLVQYIEVGVHPQEYQGKPKDPCLEFYLTFELYGTNAEGEPYTNSDGTPYLFRTWSFREGNNEKSGTYKLFKKLNYAGTAKSFAALIGNGYLLKFSHEDLPAKDGKPARKRHKCEFDNLLAPFDPVTKQPYPVPAYRPESLGLFFYRTPKKAAWDKLFIEGTNDAGKSKNWIQEKILSSVDYVGSPLQILLEGTSSAQMPSLGVPAAPAAVPAVPATTAATPVAPAIPTMPAAAPSAIPPSPAAVPPAAPAVPAAAPVVAAPAAPQPIQPWPAQAAPMLPPAVGLPPAPAIPSV